MPQKLILLRLLLRGKGIASYLIVALTEVNCSVQCALCTQTPPPPKSLLLTKYKFRLRKRFKTLFHVNTLCVNMCYRKCNRNFSLKKKILNIPYMIGLSCNCAVN